jgi:hypothetical protein
MKLGMMLVLLLVFLTVVLLQLLFTRKEAFQNAVKTQLTATNVQEVVDQFATKMISMYQELKKEATGATKDPRMLYRYAYFGNFISSLNEQYPSIQYTVQTYNWESVKPNAISLEDTQTLLDFLFYKVGRTGSSTWLTPATVNDVDLLSSSTSATLRIYGDKLLLIQGGSQIKSTVETPVRKSLEGISNLKKSFPTVATNVPLLKNDSYYYALMNASFNFVKVPEVEAIVQSGKFTEPIMSNLPIPKSVSQTISELLQKGSTTATSPATVPPATTTTAPATAGTTTTAATATATSQPAGTKFSELVQALIAYGGLSNKSATPSLSQQQQPTPDATSMTKASQISSAANVDDIRKVVRDELSEQLKAVKTGPKDVVNEDISKRATEPVKPVTPIVKTNALAQGSWFQNAAQGCPYAQGQAQTQFDPSLQPIPNPIDMNDYIRKDSIPCWGCTLK